MDYSEIRVGCLVINNFFLIKFIGVIGLWVKDKKGLSSI